MAKQRQKTPTEDRVTKLLDEADLALRSIVLPAAADAPRQVKSFRLEEFGPASCSGMLADSGLDANSELPLRLELGRTRLHPDEVHLLRAGSVVNLDQAADAPVDVYAGNRLVARGDVLVLDGKIGVRITAIVTS